jgi:hypothetical protein
VSFAIVVIPTIVSIFEMEDCYKEILNKGDCDFKIPIIDKKLFHFGVPFWNGVKGSEAAERDWLYHALDQSYENATYGTPVDEKLFNLDKNYDNANQVLSSKKLELPKVQDDNAKEENPGPPPILATLPMKRTMPFAVSATKHFFDKYFERNAEDEPVQRAIPVK